MNRVYLLWRQYHKHCLEYEYCIIIIIIIIICDGQKLTKKLITNSLIYLFYLGQ